MYNFQKGILLCTKFPVLLRYVYQFFSSVPMGGCLRVKCGLATADTTEVWAPACGKMEAVGVGTGFAVILVLEPPIAGTVGASFPGVARKERFTAAQSFSQGASSEVLVVAYV